MPPAKRVPPFKKGNWVKSIDKTHPMYGKRGIVQAVEYVGQGRTNQHMVVVVFENVHPAQRNEWQFRHQDLTLSTPDEVSAPYRKEINL